MSARSDPQLPGGAGAAARSSLLTAPLLAVAGLIASLIVVRVLDPSAFALYAVALSIRSIVQFLADMGTGSASSRAFAELRAHGADAQARRLYVRLALIRAAVIAAVLGAAVLAPDAIADALDLADDEHYFVPFVALMGVAEIVAGLGYYVLVGTFGHRLLNRVALAQSVLQPTLVIVAAATGAGLKGMLAALLAISTLRAVAFNFFAVRGLMHADADGDEIEDLGMSYARVATASVTGKLAGFVHSRQLVSVLALSSVSRPALAAFAVAYDFAHQVGSFLSTSIYSLLVPSFSTLAHGPDATRAMFHQSVRALGVLLIPCAAVLTPLFPSVAVVLFGREYLAAAEYAYVLVPALAFELTFSGPLTAIMLVRDPLVRPYRRVKLGTLAVAAAYPLALTEGLMAVALLMMGARVGSTALLMGTVWRRAGIAPPIGWLARSLASACLLTGTVLALGQLLPGRVADVAVAIPVSGILLLLLVRRLRLVEREDIELAERILPSVGAVARRIVAPGPTGGGTCT